MIETLLKTNWRTLLFFFVLLWSWLVFTTPFEYDSTKDGILFRRNRLTGKVEQWYGSLGGGFYLWNDDNWLAGQKIRKEKEAVAKTESSETKDGGCNPRVSQIVKPETYSAGLVKKAEAGDADAQFNLGDCYRLGTGVTQDSKEAFKWYAKSAEQGVAWAQSWLGYCYISGTGVTQDSQEAVKFYKKSAEQGNDQAQFFLGSCYANGTGVTQDYKEAVKWYTKSAEQGCPQAKEALEKLKSKTP